MGPHERLLVIRILNKTRELPEYAEKLGLSDVSYHVSVSDSAKEKKDV